VAELERDRYRAILPKWRQVAIDTGVTAIKKKIRSRALFRALISAGFAGKTRRRQTQPIPIVAASTQDTIVPDRVSTATPAFLAA
jgi:hypothetical protein